MFIILITVFLILISVEIRRARKHNPKRLLKKLYDNGVINDDQFAHVQQMSNLQMINFMNEQMRLMDEHTQMQFQTIQQEIDFMNQCETNSLMHTGIEFGGYNCDPGLNPSMQNDFNSMHNDFNSMHNDFNSFNNF